MHFLHNNAYFLHNNAYFLLLNNDELIYTISYGRFAKRSIKSN